MQSDTLALSVPEATELRLLQFHVYSSGIHLTERHNITILMCFLLTVTKCSLGWNCLVFFLFSCEWALYKLD